MPDFSIFAGLGALVILIGGFWILTNQIKNQSSTFQQSVADLVNSNITKTSSEQPENAARLAEVERRMEVLEADCKRYLARANTRLRRAEQLTGEDDDDEEQPTPEMLEQLSLPVSGQPQQTLSEHEQLSQIRQLGLAHRSE